MLSLRCPGTRECAPWPAGGSRADRGRRKSRSGVSITSEKAPSMRRSASAMASARVCSRECAIRCTMTSVSLVVWKMEPCLLQPGADFGGVHQVAVVRQRDLALVALHHDGLRVQQRRVAGGGIAGVADGQRAGQARQHLGAEDVGHQAHGLVELDALAVGRQRCRPIPARDVAAHTGPGKPASRPQDGHRWPPRRTLPSACRESIVSSRLSVVSCMAR